MLPHLNFGAVAQLGERHVCNVDVASSILVGSISVEHVDGALLADPDPPLI